MEIPAVFLYVVIGALTAMVWRCIAGLEDTPEEEFVFFFMTMFWPICLVLIIRHYIEENKKTRGGKGKKGK